MRKIVLAAFATVATIGCVTLTEEAKTVRFADRTDAANEYRHCTEVGPVSAKLKNNISEAETAVRNQAAALGANVVRLDSRNDFFATVSGVALKCGPITTEPLMAASLPVLCATGRDCDIKWSRAIEWLQKNSAWKFDVVTNVLITTEGPGNTTKPAFEVTRAATEIEGTDRIQIRVFCSQGRSGIFGCEPPADSLAQQFADYLR
jgi:hypothetical protein